MNRLTRWNDETESAELKNWDKDYWREFMYSLDPVDSVELGTALDKLAEYEDLEEQGLLIKLPCKEGEFVYIAKHGEKTRKVLLDSMSDILWEIEHGYAFGYTKEEAEQALREREHFW